MAITTVQAGANKLRAVKIKKHCLGPGGKALFKGQSVRIPEQDAYTLVSGQQADFITDEAAAEKEK
jgi:hypothetical protein